MTSTNSDQTVGLVSPTAVPFTSIPLGKTSFQITTSVGRSLQTYDLSRGLNLVFITRPQTPGLITATATRGKQVLAAWTQEDAPIEERRKGIWIYERGRKTGEVPIPLDLDEDLVQLHTFGPWVVGCCSSRIEVWSADRLEHYASLFPPSGSRVPGSVLTGGLCSIPTFTNKMLAGREDGTVEIWNVSTAKLIYTIQPPTSDCGPVTALQSSPAVSLATLAYMNGRVTIHDVQADEEVLTINAGQGDHSPVTSISFRTDEVGAGPDGRESGVMATASYNAGDVMLWDLNEGGKKMGTLRRAHAAPTAEQSFNDGGISKVEFLPGQSILVTSGCDNALKTWIFDETPFSPIPRILHSRSGHAASVNTLDFLPSDADGADAGGKWLLSTSKDRSFWGWSLRRDGQSAELSQGSVQKKAAASGALYNESTSGQDRLQDFKAPAITCMACSLNRDGGMGAMPGVKTLWANAKQLKGKKTATEQNITGWESVVTGHKGDKIARTWFWGRRRAGRWTLETGDGTEVRSVAISPCGTFALIGSAAGGIDMYNLQSGLHRQPFPARLNKAQAQKARQNQVNNCNHVDGAAEGWSRGQGKHTKAVTGLHVDSMNRIVISSGLDGKLKFWDFNTGSLLHEISWHGSIALHRMIYHRPNDLVAVVCSDGIIRVIDIDTRRIIRELAGCRGQINDVCFSNDGQWLLAVSSDAVLRVWDLPTGHLIEALRLSSPCSALAFSNTGEFLALAQQGSIGIDLLTNTSLFRRVSTRRIADGDIATLPTPSASGEGGMSTITPALEAVEEEAEDAHEAAPVSIEQLSDDMITLSVVPKSRWQTLLHLDLIRARNKPKEPPKAPEKAPFFLPSLDQGSKQGTEPSATAEVASLENLQAERSRIMRMDRSGGEGQITRLLRSRSYAGLLDHLKTLPPSAADIEIRSFSPMSPYTELHTFLEALVRRLDEQRDYELVQTWMAVLLKCHGEVLQEALAREEGQPLLDAFRRWKTSQQKEASRLGGLAGYCSGVVGFFRTPR